MSRLNIELFKRLRSRFARMRHPKHFHMKQIAIKTDCGAAMCLIGHTLALEGYKMRLKPKAERELLDEFERSAASRSDYEFIRPDGSVVTKPLTEAARRLRIPEYPDATLLFQDYSINSLKKAVARLDQIIATGKVLD